MILRSLRVEGWRCFAAPVSVGPFADGLNVIHGPNGVGKSTLMWALARGLFDNHGVGGADIKALQPWGRALSPRVTIEFEHGGNRYRLHKQFINGASSELARWEGGRFVPLAESRDADDRIRELLAGEVPGRGASDHRHWGLAQILWATQGSLEIEHLASGTTATIEDALGAQLTTPDGNALEQRINDAYQRFFTAGGRVRGGAQTPAVVGLQRQREEAIVRRESIRERAQEFEEASRRIEDLRRRAADAAGQERSLLEQIRELREQERNYRDLTGREQLHRQAMQAAEQAYQREHERLEEIRVTVEAATTCRRELERLREELPVLAKLADQQRRRTEQAEARLAQARGGWETVREARRVAALADRYLAADSRRQELERRSAEVAAAERERARLEELRGKITAPTKKQLAEITQVLRDRDRTRLRLDASVVTVRVRPTHESRLELLEGERPGTRTLSPGEASEFKGAPQLRFTIPDVGEFRVAGPSGDFEQLRTAWETAEEKFRELTAGWGTADVAVLEARCQEADELDRDLAGLRFKLQTLLGDESAESLREQLARAAAVVREALEDQSAWRETPPDATSLGEAAETLDRSYHQQLRDAESASQRGHDALRQAVEKRDAASAEIHRLEESATGLARRLDRLRQDGLDDDQRKRKLTEIAMNRDVEQGKLAQVREQIRGFGEDPAKALVVIESRMESIRSDAADAAQRLSNESGRLEQLGSEAPYSELARVEEEIVGLETEIGRQREEIAATKLLYETLAEQRQAVMRSVLRPISQRASRILQRITGPRFEEVHFDETLLPSGVAHEHADDPVLLSHISGGEQEQVHFAVRMALADAAFRDGRQLVVLDDVFTYTDASRLSRIAMILDEIADRFQIVLLTCHPERYRGLPSATFFDLERLADGNGRADA